MKNLKVLGTGCPKCKLLEETVRLAAAAAGLEFELEKVTDIDKILEYGVMSTPALIVDGEVKVVGRVPAVDELKQLLLK